MTKPTKEDLAKLYFDFARSYVKDNIDTDWDQLEEKEQQEFLVIASVAAKKIMSEKPMTFEDMRQKLDGIMQEQGINPIQGNNSIVWNQ